MIWLDASAKKATSVANMESSKRGDKPASPVWTCACGREILLIERLRSIRLEKEVVYRAHLCFI